MENLKRQFIDPHNEYSALPFWFWNDDLYEDEILRQIHDFHSKEIHGFVLHPRLGLPKSLPYLSERFMHFVEIAVKEAAKLDLQVILYDEGMYPSGSANGLVVQKNQNYASRGLKMKEVLCQDYLNKISYDLNPKETLVSVQAIKKKDGKVQVEETIILNVEKDCVEFAKPDDGEWSIVAFIETFSMGHIRGVHWGQDDGEPDAPRSADLLNPEAVRTFIELTHEKYYARLAKYFGDTVIAIFTDEPDLLGRGHLKGLMPWTSGFMDEFLQGQNKETDLPLLWLDDNRNKAEMIKKNFQDSIRNRLSKAYYKQLSDWCTEHNIALTGHPAESDDIGLLEHFQIPGQDVVWRFIAPEDHLGITGSHSTLGKCSSDAARHRGRRKNLNEVFGVCSKLKGWDLTADEMKWYLDWLFIRGVNLIIPHAFYYSIRNERRNERPPDVGPNNIWWEDYAQFSRYIKRMCWLMTDSTNQTEVAVLAQEAFLPWKSVKPMFENQIEFNYLEESLLNSKTKVSDGKLRIMNQEYSIVVVEDGYKFEEKTWKTLQSFVQQGGIVLQLLKQGEEKQAEIGQEWFLSEEELPFAINQFLSQKNSLTPAFKDLRISHILKDNVHFYVLVNEGEGNYAGTLFSEIKGKAELWYPWTGESKAAVTNEINEGLEIELMIKRRESVLIVVDPGKENVRVPSSDRELVKREDFSHGFRLVTLPMNQLNKDIDHLSSWTEWENMMYYSGTLVFENDLIVENPEDYCNMEIDLGEVHQIARIWINQVEAGVQMWAPYTFPIKEYLQSGKNKVVIAVTNSLANQYDQVALPSGLIGPVTLNYFK